jgi:RNA polymerase sigma factor (TIGR02999 family)
MTAIACPEPDSDAFHSASPPSAEPQSDATVHDAWRAFTPEIYEELRRIAKRHMRRQRRCWTLQTTGLVDEACERIFGQERMSTASRGDILAMASATMRCVLVDHARRRARLRRMPPGERQPMDEIQIAFENRAVDLLALDELLEELATFDPAMARVVNLHFFAGVPIEEVAELVGIPQRTLERRWKGTKAWLRSRLE